MKRDCVINGIKYIIYIYAYTFFFPLQPTIDLYVVYIHNSVMGENERKIEPQLMREYHNTMYIVATERIKFFSSENLHVRVSTTRYGLILRCVYINNVPAYSLSTGISPYTVAQL